ncbi:S9 family peptidase [Actinosynnema mirum]|uniref:Dipeptidyl-peptidase IV n=1 Tax=Actinosynnema mirum (strain ATCC 29888 / DSM 43827 / JCM 3225 / NBRC 14064 / NCIMB 13271 / NRRL B-12336 / IMRU 3971 / 101) TaxID=446462 RepID=C6W9L3_ACTMD|nr:prolyl oligopeptidase family serine peptidase [Actinosynnema mirum]ACU37230.1 Dipeptidyl-peptidase IV [Actinosynnema mirum DSM 43827]
MSLTENYRTAERLLRRPARPGELVVGDKVRPQWIDGGSRFWYAVDTPEGKRYALVDPAAGARTDLTEESLAELLAARQPPPPIAPLEVPSPDGGHAISLRGDDLWARSLHDGTEWPLTTDGAPDHAYGVSPQALGNTTLLRKIGLPHLPPAATWSPDSTRVLTHRTDERLVRQTHLVESAPADGGPPRVHTQRYPYAGDEHLPLTELVVLHVATGAVVRSQAAPLQTAMLSPVAAGWAWWSEDGEAVYYLSRPRDRRTLSLHRMDPATGEVTTVLGESGDTRVEPNQWAYEPPIVRVLADEVLWYSQRDGWGHLYRHDLRTGELIGRVTSGEWAVRQILRVADGVVHFTASGLVPEDPYRRTVCSASLDGANFTVLTDDTSDHAVTPAADFFLDSMSTVDTPPVTVVRSWSGEILVELERASTEDLIATGWTPPQRFRVKAADGVTDLYGTLHLPHDFDPSRSYPVVDTLYPGPQVTRLAPCFDPGGMGLDADPLAALGFVVLALDGRGAPGRDKSFHDASYGRLADAGALADHVAALHQLARTRPWLDLTRVAAFGHSGGGFAAVRAMLDHPDLYRVGVSLAGYHDATTFSADFVETYDGADNPESWSNTSNTALADRLQGRLLLIHGELDDRVHPTHTLRLADRLVAANKQFDLLIVPGAEHAFIDHLSYVRTRCWDFLVRELAVGAPPAYRPSPIEIGPDLLGELFA